MDKSVVVTGIGIVSPAGVGLAEFERNLSESTSGTASGTLARESGKLDLVLGAVKDEGLSNFIEPRRHLNFKHMSRSGLMVCASAALALKDAHFHPSEQTLERTGIIMGTAFGGVQSMLKFNADVRAKGPSAVNPIIFPDTVSNAPAGYAAIAFGTQGMNATLSTGFSSGLRALRVAYEQVASGSLVAALAGGYDELIPDLCHYWQTSGVLSANGSASRPFDSHRNGFYPGEGAVVLLLETRANAEQRGAQIYGQLLGFGSCQSESASQCAQQMKKCTMQRALANARVNAADIAAVFSSANGSVDADRDEAIAISDLFGPATPVAAIKSYTGECMGAAGPASVTAALFALRKKIIPGVPGFAKNEDHLKIQISAGNTRMDDRRYCLINAFGLDAQGESLILGPTANHD